MVRIFVSVSSKIALIHRKFPCRIQDKQTLQQGSVVGDQIANPLNLFLLVHLTQALCSLGEIRVTRNKLHLKFVPVIEASDLILFMQFFVQVVGYRDHITSAQVIEVCITDNPLVNVFGLRRQFGGLIWG